MIRQSNLYSRWSASTRNLATAAANEDLSSAKGDEVDELVVVEIKKFVWGKLTSRRKVISTSYSQQPISRGKYLQALNAYFHLTSGTNISQTIRKKTTPHAAAADRTVGRPLAYGATAPSRPAQRTPQTVPLPIAYLTFPIGRLHPMTQCFHVRLESKPTPRNKPAPSHWASSPTSAFLSLSWTAIGRPEVSYRCDAS